MRGIANAVEAVRHVGRQRLLWNVLKKRSLCTTQCCDQKPQNVKVCVVGSGPAGFYTTQHLVKNHPELSVDIVDRLPVPFGLVRYGVAPDHPEVKNVITSFTTVAQNPRVRFLGNVCVGKDLQLNDLQKNYHAVVFSSGADRDQALNIPGEDSGNVFSAREFVGWYNGTPTDKNLNVNLDVESAAVIGHGNVALDVARILLTPIEKLKQTDITAHALDSLIKSGIKKIYLIGRRGPLQVAFTIKELREMVKLPGCAGKMNIADFDGLENILEDLPRPRKRLTELLLKTAKEAAPTVQETKEWHIKFLRTPLEIHAEGGQVSGITLGINKLTGPISDKQKAELTPEKELLKCGLILRSIGYRSSPIEGLPFDSKRGVISNTNCRVDGFPGVYCSGWAATGPVGVILATMTNGFDVSKTILKDIKDGVIDTAPTLEGVASLLQQKNVNVVSFEEWQKIDQEEQNRGKEHNKPREKIVDISEMLKFAKH